MKSAKTSRSGLFFQNLGAILIAAVLFAASFPNILIEGGVPLLAWIAWVPMFWVIHRVSLAGSVFWGALYGYAAYALFNYWLGAFHPLAPLIVGIIYLMYFAVLFPLFKLALILFPRRGYLVQWIIWLAYEYLRTQGFLGYPYGISGYSQWSVLPLIQSASIFGVWGISALVVFPSAYIAAALRDWPGTASLRGPSGADAGCLSALGRFFLRERLPACLWLGALAGTFVYGLIAPADYAAAPAARIALIQHNTDPWKGGIAEYRDNYRVLKRLSLEALAAEPKPDLVVWSETAFVPRIDWHTKYRGDAAYWTLVKELLDFLKTQDVPFVIGNDDARRDPAKNPQGDHRVDYNAVMLFNRGEQAGLYRKMHLVPFTEYFPYRKQFPRVYGLLEKSDTHLWEPGEEATVFETGDLKFSSPICFEDTFGYLSRNFVRNGAELIVNLSNDAWSKSVPAQMQHLGMAVFRAVENRRSMVRSTASGQTCGIDPNGRILAMAAPFTEAALTVEVPIVQTETLYTRFGDIWAQIFVGLAVCMLLAGAVRGILLKTSGGKGL
ncbi:apolipoprotein N-acyltransferase 1 [Spirochaetia bacterium]|nr:apolipoprotein N-acyltransferase 1 [Spirochaetia bacterium]